MLFNIFLFLVSLYTVFPRYISIGSINALNLLSLLIFIMSWGFKRRTSKKRLRFFLKHPIFYWCSLIYVPLAYAFAGNSIEFFANLLNSLLLSFSICRVINTKEKVNILIDRIIIAAAIIGLFGIIECITRYNVINNFRSDPYIELVQHSIIL